MKHSATINNSTEIGILSVSPLEDDHGALETILRGDSGPRFKWKFCATATLHRATTMLRAVRIPIVICERDLQPGSWKEMLEETVLQSSVLIVTSRWADERLWAEVLNLGVWDLLAKPFDKKEVIRVVESAWRQWQDHHRPLTRAQAASLGC